MVVCPGAVLLLSLNRILLCRMGLSLLLSPLYHIPIRKPDFRILWGLFELVDFLDTGKGLNCINLLSKVKFTVIL